jgi:hypothetical protein
MSYQLQVNADPSKILYIDSRDATNYLSQRTFIDDNGATIISDNTAYFQYQLTEKIEVPLNQRALISLNSATIPYSFYNIRSDVNNKLFMKAEITGGGNITPTEPMTIPAGNYTAYTLINFIEKYINDNLTDGSIPFKFIMRYNTDRQKYEFIMEKLDDANANSETTLTFLFTDSPNSPAIEMGFLSNLNVSIILPPSVAGAKSSKQVDSYNVIDISGSIHGVYIRTNLVSNGTLDTQSGTFSNILARIPIKINGGGIIFAEPNNATHRSVVDLRSIDILTIRLTDERNRILDLNGLHFQVAIAIDFLYSEKKKNIPMGSLSLNNFGHSFHHQELENKRTKIKNTRK